jgi:trimethylamine--corrinoid protein Co-methyltransferase
MKLSCHFLSEDETRRIHADSVEILSEIGVEFRSDKALAILAEGGAIVDADRRIARIPEEMLDQALKTAPRSFVLGARNPKFDFPLPSSYTAYTLDGSATYAIDFETGSRRTALTKDLIDGLRIFEEMPLAAVGWPAVHCDDVPQHSVAIHANLTSFIHSSKHFQNEVFGIREVPYLIDAMAAILGSEDAIKERKIFSLVYCTIPPLAHAGDMCDAYLELAKFHVPILPYPMPCAGSTGPASLYSNAALANAESLSALVLFQFAEPGTPIIYGHAAGITNFSLGSFVEGAPESTLINGALGEMARFYDLPNTQSGCLTDAKQPGGQAIIEKALSALSLVLGGVDLINGTGELDTSQLLVLEQIVVDHEIACMCKRYRDGIDVSDAKDYLADVAAAGPGGHFITRPSTLTACRSEEFFVSALCDRNSYETWESLGRPDVYDKARQKVEEILSSPPKNPLPDDVVGRLEEIMRNAARELAG